MRATTLFIALSACSSSPSVEQTVAAGPHTVGAPKNELCRREAPGRREVNIVHPLFVDSTEVTRRAWRKAKFDIPDPSWGPDCPKCPVNSVTHAEATAFCAHRSVAAGLAPCHTCTDTGQGLACTPTHDTLAECPGHRLPTSDEWEVAARAGTTTATWAGPVTSCMTNDEVVNRIGWTKSLSAGSSHPVSLREPSPWALYDMAGNVAEWTADSADDEGRRILRGGSWYHNAEHARSSAFLMAPDTQRLSWAGFRCVRSLP